MSKKDSYLANIPAGLSKTGFLLEHQVTEAFREAGWQVINNRFYADDIDGRARELDLVIYSVTAGDEVDVVTSLLISCKKNEEMAFVFMSREKLKTDPNIDWQPVHYWTAQEPLHTYLTSANWKAKYISDNRKVNDIFEIRRDAFATQLVSQERGTAQNDRVIFESISGLMKALDYEIHTLPSRMKKKRLYLFNLLTVVDAPIVDAQFSGDEISPVQVTDFKYLSRYMVRKQELTARIHFANKTEMQSLVKKYSLLAEHDGRYFQSIAKDSYDAIKTNAAIQLYFSKILSPLVRPLINRKLKSEGFAEIEDDVLLSYRGKELWIEVPLYEDGAIQVLTQDPDLKKRIGHHLRSVARYKGAFTIGDVFPF